MATKLYIFRSDEYLVYQKTFLSKNFSNNISNYSGLLETVARCGDANHRKADWLPILMLYTTRLQYGEAL
jgi:hypothetical protein